MKQLIECVPNFSEGRDLNIIRQITDRIESVEGIKSVSYTHLRAHETVLDIVCRLLLEKKNKTTPKHIYNTHNVKQ